MKSPWFGFRGVILLALGAGTSLRADVKMPAIFGDHMVLQQEATLPVWGWAAPGEKVTVSVGGESASATTDADGKWMVKLPPLPNGAPPTTMTVAGKNTLTFSDVLVGEVWLASGQSNMAFGVVPQDSATANDSQIRFFVVPRKTGLHPADDITAKWVVCSPETAKQFSAVGYLFARDLRAALQRPVGMIGCYWSGSGAHSWVSIDGFRATPALKCYADAYDDALANYQQKIAGFAALQAAYQAALTKWQQQYGSTYATEHKKWYDALEAAARAGTPAPPRPATMPPDPPPPPVSPDGGPHTPSSMFNGMVAPLIPYSIKGVIWYQGESNHARPREYKDLLAALITDWRRHWGEGDFSFLIVQLPNLKTTQPDWPFTRESQLKVAQTLPNTGLAVTIDVGDPNNLHPRNKLYVGQRLTLAARHVAYGQDLVYSGPIYASEKFEGNAIRIGFTQTGTGLKIGSAPYLPPNVTALPTTSLAGFTIAGDDGNFVPADAKIDGNTVIVSSPQVPHPVAVRYAWDEAPRCNLYNNENLPASPFRTDNLPPTSKTEDWMPWRITSPVPAYARGLPSTPPDHQ